MVIKGTVQMMCPTLLRRMLLRLTEDRPILLQRTQLLLRPTELIRDTTHPTAVVPLLYRTRQFLTTSAAEATRLTRIAQAMLVPLTNRPVLALRRISRPSIHRHPIRQLLLRIDPTFPLRLAQLLTDKILHPLTECLPHQFRRT